ncbi:MAG: hypothetical protein WC793_03550 [Candidatus Paceibacterota bacterium]|jgi:hypothetical protein
MKAITLKTIKYSIPVIFIALAILYFHYGPAPNLSKCPDDYPDTDAGFNEKMADMNKWTNDFYDNHPGATLGDWNKARYQYWIDNRCTEALKRYNESKALLN